MLYKYKYRQSLNIKDAFFVTSLFKTSFEYYAGFDATHHTHWWNVECWYASSIRWSRGLFFPQNIASVPWLSKLIRVNIKSRIVTVVVVVAATYRMLMFESAFVWNVVFLLRARACIRFFLFFDCFSFKSDTIKWICICTEVYHATTIELQSQMSMRYLKNCSISLTHTGCWHVLVISPFLNVCCYFPASQFVFAVVDSCARLYVLGWECNFQWSQVFEKYPIWRQMFVFYFDILEWVFAYKTATILPKLSSLPAHIATLATHPSSFLYTHTFVLLLSTFHQTASQSFFRSSHTYIHIFIRTRKGEQEHKMKSGRSRKCETKSVCKTLGIAKHAALGFIKNTYSNYTIALPLFRRRPLFPKSFYICALTPFTHGSTSWRDSTGASNRIYGQLFMCHRNNSNNTTVNREKWLSTQQNATAVPMTEQVSNENREREKHAHTPHKLWITMLW